MLSGLTRVRQFSQDDAHCFVTEEQIGVGGRGAAAAGAARLRRLRPGVQREAVDAAGGVPGRDRDLGSRRGGAEAGARRGRRSRTRSTTGDGAFYGPKIDFDITDAIGRKWQCATIQLDYQMPERFDLKYIGADNAEHRPVVIHRAIFGSFERFIALLIEHYAGAFPLWLAPVQAIVLPIADRHLDYARGGARPSWPRPGFGSSSTSGRRRLDIRSAKPSCRRSPTCWSSATARRPKATVAVRHRAGGDQGAQRLEAVHRGRARTKCARAALAGAGRAQQRSGGARLSCLGGSLSLSTEARGGTTARGSTNGSGSARCGSSTTPGSSWASCRRSRR